MSPTTHFKYLGPAREELIDMVIHLKTFFLLTIEEWNNGRA